MRTRQRRRTAGRRRGLTYLAPLAAIAILGAAACSSGGLSPSRASTRSSRHRGSDRQRNGPRGAQRQSQPRCSGG